MNAYSKYQDYGFKSISSFPHMCDVLPGSTHTCAATNTSIIEPIIVGRRPKAADPQLWGRPKAAPIIDVFVAAHVSVELGNTSHMCELSLATHHTCVGNC